MKMKITTFIVFPGHSVHFRYIQACYIRKKSLEAKEKAQEDARRQILTTFFATEELRLEVQRREQAAERKEAMKMLNKSLEVLETKLPHLTKMLSVRNCQIKGKMNGKILQKDSLLELLLRS